ncbi:DUF4133 domain-containing protein [Sphingobacterium paludis]|uniref:DUF4133 domain-containing protein n=1 Tax=Sphingobacterium paludis TaxID=1476465 RepID=A0A4R7CRZ2_9SPHI|nr:DUF4133 domain-containing protein [Sphingobacterium paludis]TDS06585.1 hypothetical protein B0I21_11625 [Sphingobacterium paludis]
MRRYAIYKGLQRPLVYRGFKGKFIGWGIGSLVLGLVGGGLLGALSSMYLGAVVTLAVIAGGLTFTFQRQKGGLHVKTRSTALFVHQAKLKHYGKTTSGNL